MQQNKEETWQNRARKKRLPTKQNKHTTIPQQQPEHIFLVNNNKIEKKNHIFIYIYIYI